MNRIGYTALSAALVMAGVTSPPAVANAGGGHAPGSELPQVHAVTPPHDGSGGNRRVTTPAEANNPAAPSPTRIIQAVRHPLRGADAIRRTKPPQKIAIVHVNTAVKGDQAAAIKAAADDNLAAIRDLRKAVQHADWLTLKLTSLHVDPNALIGASTGPNHTLILITY